MDSLYIQLLQAILVFGGILGLVYVVSRFMKAQWRGPASLQGLTLMGALQVGTKSRVVLVHFADRVYVLGVTDESVTVVDKRHDAELPDELLEFANEQPQLGDWIAKLRSQMGRHGKGGDQR